MVRSIDQRLTDRDRQVYTLNFPANMESERITAWVRSVSGSLRARRSMVGGSSTIAFEMIATQRGITHRLRVPTHDAEYVVAQLRSLVPGIRVQPEEDMKQIHWTAGAEVGMTNKSRQLRIFEPADMAASLLAAVQPLNQGEAVIVQWVVTPAIPVKPPVYHTPRSRDVMMYQMAYGHPTRDDVRDRRSKLEEPNVLAVLRVASRSRTPGKARHLVKKVRNSLSSARTPSTRFVRRFVGIKRLRKRIDAAAGSIVFPAQLSATELTALIAWPIGNPFVTGLPPALSRHLPASEAVARRGRVIGRSNMPGNERPIAVTYENTRKHTHVMGPTGVGKTALLGNTIKQDIEQGCGIILIERKGDLFQAALDYVPPQRVREVVVLDVTDTNMPVGFNILRQGNPLVAVDELTRLFEHLYSDGNGVWTRQVLYHGLRTLAQHPELTFIDLAPLLVPMNDNEAEWRKHIIKSVQDQELQHFWSRFESQPRAAQDKIVQPVMDRIWQLNARPELRHIIGQSASSFEMDDVVRNNKILLVNLAGIAPETANLTGTLIMNALWHSVQRVRSSRINCLYLDEFQDYINLPVDPEDMLAKARSFGLAMTLAHQHLAQLPTSMRQAIIANARSKVVFQTNGDDARAMAREFGSTVTDHDFLHLGNFETITRVATDSGISPPLTMATLPPADGYGLSKQVRAVSRSVYGRTAEHVEASIVGRRNVQGKPRQRRPKIGGEGWS